MHRQIIKFKNFNGIDIADEFMFNLTKTEVIELELGESLSKALQLVGEGASPALILGTFTRLIEASYGKLSQDGNTFNKSPEIWSSFKQSAAYDAFFMEFVTNSKTASEFINGVMPADLEEFVERAQKNAQPRETRTLPIENVHTGAAGNVFDNSPEVNKLTVDQLRAELNKRTAELTPAEATQGMLPMAQDFQD